MVSIYQMDKFLIRSASNPTLSKRQADDPAPATRTAKRLAFTRAVDRGRPQSIFHENSFEPLQTDVDTDTDSISIEKTATPRKHGRIPPIVLTIDKEWTHERVKNAISKYTKSFQLQYRGKGKIAVICFSANAHQDLKEGLLKDNVQYLTYSRKDEKTPKLVIRGLPNSLFEQLSAELTEMGYKDSSITIMRTKYPVDCPPILVKLAPGADVKKFRQIKIMLNCVVTITRYRPNRSLGTQCFRCQEFGHSSRNCNMPPRCIKCINKHPQGECPKKNRNEPAKCVNCSENHPANYKDCSARLAYLQRIRDIQDQQKRPRKNLPVALEKSWADIIKGPTPRNRLPIQGDGKPNSAFKSQITILEQRTAAKIQPIYEAAPDAPETNHYDVVKDILDVLTAVRELKSKFGDCKSMLDKVMLVLTHLGHCV